MKRSLVLFHSITHLASLKAAIAVDVSLSRSAHSPVYTPFS